MTEYEMVAIYDKMVKEKNKEIERLKHQIKVQEDLTIKNRMRKHIYKSRCEKAIEYIEELNKSIQRFWFTKLLNILQNGSEKNEC